MDSIDRKIIAALQQDGRMTLTELAKRVQLSLSRCQRRVRDLEESGVILGYGAQVSAAAVGFGFEVLAFATLSQPDDVLNFDAALIEVPEIIEAQRLFGTPDYMLRIVSESRETYQKLYDEVLCKLPGLAGLSSTIVMKQTVVPRGLPLHDRSLRSSRHYRA
ncbi:Lrp/AsnC family transcriptional regulator [Glutamicibacter sp. JL.03c]|uniref:Lrp/AsnC family transcriptional regulator n=1 Tax=Glutamicibacter sp. JL.03c TaxID=2984842 RepID=UPI0021F6D3A8|nr:Lrp/AsnC family transcriptional regulator [Glutamicibacter sp. JL.03c]UYQ77738.1 Lrp/AsnC family transcriptional regulator [Glutamicibacter sp. JL.03c]